MLHQDATSALQDPLSPPGAAKARFPTGLASPFRILMSLSRMLLLLAGVWGICAPCRTSAIIHAIATAAHQIPGQHHIFTSISGMHHPITAAIGSLVLVSSAWSLAVKRDVSPVSWQRKPSVVPDISPLRFLFPGARLDQATQSLHRRRKYLLVPRYAVGPYN